jgi:hypothetical protein
MTNEEKKIEEAAIRYGEKYSDIKCAGIAYYDGIKSDASKEYWQKGMYTEEEVYKILHSLMSGIHSSNIEINDDGDLREWLSKNNKRAVEGREEMRKIMEG